MSTEVSKMATEVSNMIDARDMIESLMQGNRRLHGDVALFKNLYTKEKLKYQTLNTMMVAMIEGLKEI